MYKNRDWLCNEYIEKKQSSADIGKECGVSAVAIRYWLRKFEIGVRTKAESRSLYLQKHLHPMKGRKHSKETKEKMSKRQRGRKVSDVTKRKLSEINTGRRHSEETRQKMLLINRRILSSEETRRKISAAMQGCSLGEWNGYVSYKPYCSKFNFEKKEEIRNQYNRVCIISGISVLQNGQRLSVDHVDENKMQGCNGVPFKLILLSQVMHGKMNKQQNHLLLELLLYGNKKAELNYEFEKKK